MFGFSTNQSTAKFFATQLEVSQEVFSHHIKPIFIQISEVSLLGSKE